MRYDETKILKDPKRYYGTTVYPKFEARETDIYIISRAGDRLDNLAFEYYQDAGLWWVIARANNIGKGTLNVPVGIQVRIPLPLTFFDIEQALKNSEQTR